MNNTFKKVTAGMLSLALVAGAVPANVGGFLTGGTAIVASAAPPESTNTGVEIGGAEISKAKTLSVGTYIKVGDTVDFGDGTYIDVWGDPNFFNGACKLNNNVEFYNNVNWTGYWFHADAVSSSESTEPSNPDGPTHIGEVWLYGFMVESAELSTAPTGFYVTGGSGTAADPFTFELYMPHAAVAPTCTTTGNIKYYTGENGEFYTKDGIAYTALTDLNGDGYVDIDDTVVAETGHSYDDASPVWTWKKEDGVYTVSVQFKCKVCGNVETPEEKPVLNETDHGNGVKTYTATINYGGQEYTSTKDENIIYNISIDGVESSYKYGEQIKAVASAMRDGKHFIGWYEVKPDDTEVKVSGTRNYYFYATRDMSIVPHYSYEIVEAEPVYSMNVSRVAIANSDKQKISFTVDWELPKNYELIEAGVVRSYINENPEIGGADVSQKASSLKTVRGTFVYNLTLGTANANNTIYSKAYVTYRNKLNDQIVTVYTAPFTTAKA
ncbi:hypothetical protein [Ruminococcus albus]|uniref:Bacterial repeat domain-containing protein n=1 Tax=Ruminococcus albus TaxID=1264 RepID=A0A1H7KMD3_RUMAL|nr:hypothetical protein [Ruminococcus albus]SEK87918.1 hypothetical protein SAMN05216469_10723 [Ruminococcus albus]